MADKSKKFKLRIIFFSGLLLRLIFLIISPDNLPGSRSFFTTNDSFSFSNAFINLLEHGIYSFDLNHPDARFGRLPGYPFFWGLHYLIYGAKNVYVGVALTQAVLDSIVILLLYKISYHLIANTKYALSIAIIYAFNPFSIYWVPITGTETLGIFITVFFFYFLFLKSHWRYYAFMLGLIGVTAFFIREYLALLMLSGVVYLWLIKPKKVYQKIFIASMAFWVIYAAWPIRNYIVSDEFILVKTSNSGYHRYGSDITSCRKYIFTWTADFDYYMDSVFTTNKDFDLPKEAIPDGYTETQIKETIQKALLCGSGFLFWKEGEIKKEPNCDDEVSKEFMEYRKALFKTHPFRSYFKVPFQNLYKMYFKNETVHVRYPILENFLFLIRTLILLGATVGLFIGLGKLKPEALATGIFFVSIYFLIGFVLRQVEMRYLLQADVAIFPFLILLFNYFRIKGRNYSHL